jgi:adenine-specific DNA-methyltransferase
VIQDLFGEKIFPFSKPLTLLTYLVVQATSNGQGIVLDFFAGSGTCGHAVLAANATDQGSRRYVMVQISEASDTGRSDFKTIADIGKERLRRAGRKIKAESAITAPDLDIGFRVLKVDSSNMNEVYYAPDAVTQDALPGLVNNIRADRTAEDLLFQVLLDWGVDLALPINQKVIAGKTVFFVDGNAMAACFETGIDEDFVKQLAAHKPLRVVFRDAGFVSDSVKINVEQVFKLLSPATEIKTL